MLWLHSLKVAQLLRSAACLHTNQSQSYLNHLVQCVTQYGSLSYFTLILTCRNCSSIYSFHIIIKASSVYEIIQSIVFNTIIIATKS